MARIYVWLRYSAIRQLTWQRNYNTQPRILGAAQDRLSKSIANAYAATAGPAQVWAARGGGGAGLLLRRRRPCGCAGGGRGVMTCV